MADQILRDRNSRIIGRIEDRPNEQILRDRNSRIKGRYDKRTDITRDERGHIVGTGNLLAGLVSASSS